MHGSSTESTSWRHNRLHDTCSRYMSDLFPWKSILIVLRDFKTYRSHENKQVTPSFYYVFNISLYCNDAMPSFIGNLWGVLLLGNHLKPCFLLTKSCTLEPGCLFTTEDLEEGVQLWTRPLHCLHAISTTGCRSFFKKLCSLFIVLNYLQSETPPFWCKWQCCIEPIRHVRPKEKEKW